MSLVLVLFVVSLALAEAGYQYNAPSVSFVPGNQPANLQPGRTLQHHAALPNLYDKPLTHSISYKDYVYLKQDNVHNSGHHGNNAARNDEIVAAPDKQATAGPSLNSGIPGYVQSFAPASIVNSNNNYAQSSALANTNFNSDHIQNFLSISNGNVNSGSKSNFGYLQNSISSVRGSLNSGYVQSPPLSAAINENQGHPQTPILLNNHNNGYLQILVPYSTSSIASNSKAQTSIASDLNTKYSQTFKPSGFSIPTVVNSNNFNTGYSHPLFAGTASTRNGLAQATSSSASSSLTTGSSQVQLATPNLNTGYSQSLINQISGNLINSYASSDGTSLDKGISQIPTNIFTVNPNPTSSFDASVNSDNIQSSPGSANSNIVFTQTSSKNNFNVNSNAAVFKHVYFHVPPPDVEDQKVLLPPLPKKNYKILFIKLPLQDSKTDLATLKRIAEMSNAAASIEHKTLIYVLVKNPETQEPVVIPERTPSEPEVFFVKYNGNPLDIAAEVKDELEKSGTVRSIIPLEPGLVNGNK